MTNEMLRKKVRMYNIVHRLLIRKISVPLFIIAMIISLSVAGNYPNESQANTLAVCFGILFLLLAWYTLMIVHIGGWDGRDKPLTKQQRRYLKVVNDGLTNKRISKEYAYLPADTRKSAFPHMLPRFGYFIRYGNVDEFSYYQYT